jgi:RNA polymerase sigma factor (sigma-70 family)
MVARERGTQQRDDAKLRYEAARQQLTEEFGDRVQALVGVPPQALVVTEDTYAHRAAVIESGMELIVPLRRFVERELQDWIAPEILQNGVVEVDDVVADIYLAAVDHAETAPVARAFYTWLRRIARREVRRTVLANDERAQRERSIYGVVSDYDEEWPEDVAQLIDLLADPNAELPEDMLERDEAREVLASVLMRLPEQWREIFLMKVVDGLQSEEISTFEGIDPQEVNWKVAMSREFLRSWLEQARYQEADV